MREWVPWAVTAIVAAIAIAGLAAYVGAPQQTRAPDFTLTSTGFEVAQGLDRSGEGVSFNLSDYRGQVVILDFMAVSCLPCREVTAEVLRPLHTEGMANVTILSIDTWADPTAGAWTGETREDLIALQKRENATWRHALDTDEVYRKYAAIQLPKLVVVDADGRIAYTESGKARLEEVRAAVARAGETSSSIPNAGLVGLAAAAGLVSLFAPCAIGLLPAYLGMLLRTKERSAVLGGLKVSAGMLAGYAGLAAVLVALAQAGLSDALRRRLADLELAMGVVLVVLGILMLAKFDWGTVGRRLGLRDVDGRRGLLAFGVGYGLASFACTGPILLPILVAGLANGAGGVLAVFAAYAACLAAFLLATALLVGTGRQRAAQWFVRHAEAASRASAALILVGGAYLVWYYWSVR